jgi:hypothetical protein
MKFYAIGILFIVLGATLAAPDAPNPMMVGGSYSLRDSIQRIFKHRDSNFDEIRHPTKGAPARADMLKFIQNQIEQLQLLARQKNFAAINDTQTFQTDIQVQYNHVTVNGTNVILVLHGSANATEDEPILLLANYDTATTANAIDEGSGVVALLTLIESLVQDLPDKNVELKSSVIFAFTDVSHKKYDEDAGTPRGSTGAHILASEWIPKFMVERKRFLGAIVLDNLLNYNNTERSQLVGNTGMDKSFPTTYMQMAENAFAGNFLGLVHRNDHMDNPLADALESAWNRSDYQTKRPESNRTHLDTRLLRFTITKNMFMSASVNHFLNSEQSGFWNEHNNIGQTQYPAVTLTDTRNLRFGCRQMCSLNSMLTEDNLLFMEKTVRTLKRFIIQNQTVDNGALSTVQASLAILISSTLFAIYWQ